MIYIFGHWKVEINRYVTFNESEAFSKSKYIHVEELHEEEHELPRVLET